MPEIVLRLRVIDHSGPKLTETWWQKHVSVGFLPAVGDDIQLWGAEDGVLVPVKRRWWRIDGRVLVETVELVIDSPNLGDSTGRDGRFRWVPWRSDKGDPGSLLCTVGWEMLRNG